MEILLIACVHGAVTYFYAITHDDDRKVMIFTWINVVVACFLGNPIFSAIDIAAVFAGSTFGANHRDSFPGLRRNKSRTKPPVEKSSANYAELEDKTSSLITPCRQCGQRLRIPRGMLMDATCPKCRHKERYET